MAPVTNECFGEPSELLSYYTYKHVLSVEPRQENFCDLFENFLFDEPAHKEFIITVGPSKYGCDTYGKNVRTFNVISNPKKGKRIVK